MDLGLELPGTEKEEENEEQMETPRRTVKRRALRAVERVVNTMKLQKITNEQETTKNCQVEEECIVDEGIHNNLNSKFNSHEIIQRSPSLELRNMSKIDALKNWTIKNNITHTATNELLVLLNEWLPNEGFCRDARTLLKTPRTVSIHTIDGGELAYIGVARYLSQVIEKGLVTFAQLPENLQRVENLISLKVGIDGIPISKSSNLQFWPVLFSIDQAYQKQVFVASIFYGSTKPSCIFQFLELFVNEMSLLEKNGFEFKGRKYNIRIRCICADAPARSFLKNIKNHNAYYGCERCYRKGKWAKRVIYPFKANKFSLHTDDSFKLQLHAKHHEGHSPLLELDLGLVSQIPLDYMHLCCLGVMRKLLFCWTDIIPYKLSIRQVRQISDRLIDFRKKIPKDFSRKTRSLKDLRHWKATELRLFMLYAGPSALFGILDDKRFRHFLLFHCGMYILTSQAAQDPNWLHCAENLINLFVSKVPELYSKELLSYNMHTLQHLVGDVKIHGSVDNFSCFEFENHMQHLKRLLRSNSNH